MEGPLDEHRGTRGADRGAAHAPPRRSAERCTGGDRECIERARNGDATAMRELYERHAQHVFAVTRCLAGDDALAEDWAQEAWIRAFRALPGFRGDARFSTWLHRIAVNSSLHGRRGRARRTDREVQLDEALTSHSRPDVSGLRIDLQRALDRLPPGMRQVLVLHSVQGYTHEEIAETLGISAGTSKSQLFRARARLRDLLDPAPTAGRYEAVSH
jgi:RNA polymerase sigma-70 factor (ECF subfamily)